MPIDKAKEILLKALLEARCVIVEALAGHEITDAPYGMDVEANAGLDWHSIQLVVQTQFTWQDQGEESADTIHVGDPGPSADLAALEW